MKAVEWAFLAGGGECFGPHRGVCDRRGQRLSPNPRPAQTSGLPLHRAKDPTRQVFIRVQLIRDLAE